MVLSKRERVILIATIVVAGAVLAYWLIVSPLLDARAATAATKAKLTADAAEGRLLMAQRQRSAAALEQMKRSNLKTDPAEAEAQVLHAMRRWAEGAGLGRGQVQTVRIAGKGRFSEIEFQTSYSGTMRGITQLLWQIESADIPIRVVKLQIASRKEGQDDLNFELRLSTLYAPKGQPAPARAGGGG
ncbi:MAG: hypothetical protein LLG01_15065 [Planctomycetaceae bacterium]|nr:hypothetical protein [Planctomycetaceae bacterium]